MIKWMCHKIVKWAQEYDAYRKFQESDDRAEIVYGNAVTSSKRHRNLAVASSDGPDIQRTFRFDVTVARGGVIVTTRRYDPKKDETSEIINVLHDNSEDLSKDIAGIVSMEILKS